MLIKVTVFPDSREDRIEMIDKETYRVYVRASAQHNHANKVMLYLLTKHLGKGVTLVSGGTRSHKIVRVY